MAKQFQFFYYTSDLYSMPTYISIYSLLKYYQGESIDILILHNDLSSRAKERFKSLEGLNIFKPKVKIDFFDSKDLGLDEETLLNHVKYSQSNHGTRNLSIQTFFRLWIPMMTDAQRGLSLDSDVIIVDDISELVNFPLTDDDYIAACKHISWRSGSYLEWLDGRQNTYVNSGVILWNLDVIRKNGLMNKMIDDAMTKQFLAMDQDVININCYGHIKYLPIEYNLGEFMRRLHHPDDVFTEEDLRVRDEHPKIIHFSSRNKPWRFGADPNTAFGRTLAEIFDKELITPEEYQNFVNRLP